MDAAVSHYLGQGFTKDKLVLGMPCYGRTWSGPSGFQWTWTTPGPDNGTLLYKEIMQRYGNTPDKWISAQ